ncbi:DUF190 domain-containing protein [Nonomuraea fuscirosea]|uniref:DUF190 domain-containing protein n=1 Tax=Nonomuraea fuscirosea TaxID=1291556 RepID=UPI002DDB1425|nr:DUF190 domain-containing protein [Nonomuraea fuscirosea]WSA50975.1 DUF190 domain-containing protein [Nonomuraea fuscirosea]
MKLDGTACRLTVIVGEHDQYRHRPLFTEIVHRAKQAGLGGASVFRGLEGFGASSLIHTSHLWHLSDDLPIAIIIVDAEPKIRDFLQVLDDLVTGGLVITDRVQVRRSLPGPAPTGSPSR